MSDPSASLRALGDAAQASPRDPVRWYRWAVALARVGQHTTALQAARHALPHADRAPVAVNLGKLFEVLEQHGDAVHAYRRAAHLDPLHVEAQLCLGSLLRRLDDPRAAALSLRVAATRAPKSAAIALELAAALLAAQQPAEALREAERAKELGETHDGVQRLLARAHEALGQLAPCLAALATLPTLEDEDLSTLLSAARRLALQGDVDAAVAALDRGRRVAPAQTAQVALGSALFDLGALSAARETLAAAARAAPDDGEAHLALGRAQAASGASGDAITTLRTAIRLAPRDARPLAALASIIGDPTEASSLLMQAAALAPQDDEIREALARTLAATPRRGSSPVPARRSPPPRAATGGITSDLAMFSLPELLDFLVRQRATGSLSVRNGSGLEGSLELHDGQLVAARYPGGRRLSDVLIEEDLVSRTDLLRAAPGSLEEDGDAKLASAVLESQLVGRETLADLVRRQIEAALAVLVRWRTGQAVFHRSTDATRPRPDILVDARWAVITALGAVDEDERAARHPTVPPLPAAVALTGTSASRASAVASAASSPASPGARALSREPPPLPSTAAVPPPSLTPPEGLARDEAAAFGPLPSPASEPPPASPEPITRPAPSAFPNTTPAPGDPDPAEGL